MTRKQKLISECHMNVLPGPFLPPSQLVERCKQDKVKCSEKKKLITLEATFKNTSRETILAIDQFTHCYRWFNDYFTQRKGNPTIRYDKWRFQVIKLIVPYRWRISLKQRLLVFWCGRRALMAVYIISDPFLFFF